MFSRKQAIQARPLDLNSVLRNLANMITRLLGETIKVESHYAASLPQIQADTGMLEQVVMNLAVNARDAMPKGGRLIVTTQLVEVDAEYVRHRAEARPGRFVCLSVQDTGCGMERETLARIFEPFFSTKEVGRGTGLGLSTVYGIVKQHQGWVEVTSEVGVGTAFRILFPAAGTSGELGDEVKELGPVRGGRETILHVEDEPGLRQVVRDILTQYNYHIEIFGPESSAKTTLALSILAEAQKEGGVAAFIDAEHAFDPGYAHNLGVDTESLLVSQPDYGEQALEILETLVRSGAVDIVVIDSVTALTPKAEIDGEMGDAHRGLEARLMSQALRKITAIASKTNTTVVFLNQLRMKIGVMFGNPETTTGGNALKFYASVRMDIRQKEKIISGEETVGSLVRVKVVKNKVAPPFREASFEIRYGEGIDKSSSLIDAALKHNVIEKKVLRTAPAFAELRIEDGSGSCIVDLVAEPFPVEAPVMVRIEDAAIAVDTRRELLASKLATLLERSEIRHLADVKALLDAGGDLETGLRDAPAKDAGFSPLTLAWVLKSYDPRPAARALGSEDARMEDLVSFRRWLIDRLTALATPE